MDTQVVLQQAQQIIDASLMQQTPTSRQQHVCLLVRYPVLAKKSYLHANYIFLTILVLTDL